MSWRSGRPAAGTVRIPGLAGGIACLLILAPGLGGCSTGLHEPANLTPHKEELRRYVDSGRYLKDVSIVAERAKRWIEARAARGGEKLTVVFDLDETLLMNWPHISAMDFGYVPAAWNEWVEQARAPALEPIREVYRRARALGVDVVFITGRPETQRAGTERNLQAIECGDFARLICKPPGHKGPSRDFKTAARQRLIAEGRTIIANIGDQHSDLDGGAAERTFKVPNAFYQLP